MQSLTVRVLDAFDLSKKEVTEVVALPSQSGPGSSEELEGPIGLGLKLGFCLVDLLAVSSKLGASVTTPEMIASTILRPAWVSSYPSAPLRTK